MKIPTQSEAVKLNSINSINTININNIYIYIYSPPLHAVGLYIDTKDSL